MSVRYRCRTHILVKNIFTERKEFCHNGRMRQSRRRLKNWIGQSCRGPIDGSYFDTPEQEEASETGCNYEAAAMKSRRKKGATKRTSAGEIRVPNEGPSGEEPWKGLTRKKYE